MILIGFQPGEARGGGAVPPGGCAGHRAAGAEAAGGAKTVGWLCIGDLR